MKSIGVDIGTTTICAVLMDADKGNLLTAKTLPNTSVLSVADKWEKRQDPYVILDICSKLIDSFLEIHKDVVSIGVTGQMHGILYINDKGESVSPLFTWQDGRGNRIYKDGISYADYMTRETGINMATGFGLTTHYYNIVNRLVPKGAVTFCTIPDFVAMSLAQLSSPLLHPSMAASMGLYDIQSNGFNKNALEKLNIPYGFLPLIAATESMLGYTKEGIKVAPALGDNQASFLGAVNQESNMLVNVGTGSQISVWSEHLTDSPQGEYRPYINQTYLMVGSPLCGGYSYSILKNFFEDVLTMFQTTTETSIYERMNYSATKLYEKGADSATLEIDTRLNGTRSDSMLTGSVKNLTTATFHPEHFILGVLQGIGKELHEFYEQYPAVLKQSKVLIGSGNGIRMNVLLQRIFCDMFQMSMKIPLYSEEAAYGSALFSLYAMQYYKTIKEIQALIKYQS